MKTASLFVFAATVLIICAPLPAAASTMAIADLHNPGGGHVGIATITEGDDGLTIAVNVHGMPPGPHALHIHTAGSCEKPDFKSAKGHFNPYGREHGLKNPQGPHAGDLLNIVVGPDGTGATIVVAPLVTLGPGDNSLFREGGTAIMIHQGPDDYVSDPAGDAGPRIACGVIRTVE
jgi:Cu-Zn family superoxide dismutase